MAPAKKASYGIMLLLLVGMVWLHIGASILAGLCAYMILDLTWRLFSKKLSSRLSRWLSLLVFLVSASFISLMLARFIHQAINTLPQIAVTAIPKLTALCASFGIELPFANVYDLRESVIEQVKENANSITKASGFLTHGFFRILFAVIIAILAFFSEKEEARYELHAFDALRREFNKRVYLFLLSFERVFGAQIVIAAINSLLTLVFLLLMGLPHVTFLALATFILGTLPFIGNIISNTIIVSVALVVSPRQAAYALAYLILIHKLEYFLNANIVGARTQTSTWQALLAVVLGEVVMGVPGILLAPAVLHYAKQELRTIPTGVRV